jgi:hypothetical protein
MQDNCRLKLLMRATAVVCIWLVVVIALSVGGLGRQAGWLPVVVTLLPFGMAIWFAFFLLPPENGSATFGLPALPLYKA